MRKMLSITKHEYKMQIKRIAGRIVLLFVLVSSMMDCLPVAANLSRIEFLGDIHYYVWSTPVLRLSGTSMTAEAPK